MSKEVLEISYSPSSLRDQYCLENGEARRLLTSFGSCPDEMDRLLAAKGRTMRHRTREMRTPLTKVPFGIW